jgi:hypothetical protein
VKFIRKVLCGNPLEHVILDLVSRRVLAVLQLGADAGVAHQLGVVIP